MISLLITLLVSGAAWSQSLPKPGQIYQERKCELGGKPARIGLSAYRIQKESDSYWGQLKVWDAQGKLLWQAPQAKKADEPFAFGIWPYGSSGLEWVGGTETILYSPRAQSDVRPATYRRYRWTGSAFQPMPAKMLLESPLGSGTFVWKDPIEWDGQTALTWVMEFTGTASAPVGKVYASKPGGQLLMGEARLLSTSGGFQVRSWVKKLSAN